MILKVFCSILASESGATVSGIRVRADSFRTRHKSDIDPLSVSITLANWNNAIVVSMHSFSSKHNTDINLISVTKTLAKQK